MKKTLLLCVLWVFMLGMFAQTAIAPALGDGSTDNPYQISTWENVLWISDNADQWNKHYIQMNHITFPQEINTWNENRGWNPIGNAGMTFTGVYDGNNYTISGIYIHDEVSSTKAFFGNTSSVAMIKNLGLLNVNILANGTTAGLIASNYATVDNCYVTGLVISRADNGGGITAFNSGYITNCYNSALVHGITYVGGIAGQSYRPISNCYNIELISGENMVGGIIGYNFSQGTVNNCYNNAFVTGITRVGGIAGYARKNISNSYSTNSIYGEDYVGGLVGRSQAIITNCYSRSNVFRYENSSLTNIGAFIGQLYSGSVINSYATGSVTYVNTDNPTNAGFIGSLGTATVSSSFWDINTSGQSSSGYTGEGLSGKTTAEMTTQALSNPNIYTLASWDFKGETANGVEDIWNIGNGRNDGYPYLNWQYPNDDATLPVSLSSFLANSPSSNCVNITWSTESECNIAGYHIYRNSIADLSSAQRISNQLINASNQSAQQTYTYEDLEVEANQTYFYWLKMIEANSSSQFFGPVSIKTMDDSIIPETHLITQLDLVYPNPINTSGKATFGLRVSESETANLRIYNVKGQLVKEFKNIPSGAHHIVWDNKDQNNKQCSSGVYFYQLSSPSYFSTKKMLLIK